MENIIYENKKEETTFYRFYSEIRKFLENILKNPIKTKPSKYLEDRKFTKERLIKLLMNNNIIKRDEKILVPGKDDVKHVQYSIKYTLKPESFNDKIEKIYKKYFGDDEAQILKEEMDMFSCANIVGVVSGRGKGVGSEMCDRWANYVNKKKDKPRFLFKEDNELDVRAQAMRIWIDNKLEDSLYWHEEMWTDHEFDPEWGDVQFNGWNFYTTENSDDIEFKSPDGEEGWFLKSEVNDGKDRETYLTRGGIKF